MKWLRRTAHPPVVSAYLAAQRRSPGGQTPLGEVPWLVLDAETTGFQRGRDRVLSLAVLPLEGNRLELARMREWLVYQEIPAPTEATAVHGILPEEIRTGRPEREVLEELLPLLEGRILVGHHVRFDAGMLDEMLRRHFGVRLRNEMVDTAELAVRHLAAFHRTGYANQRPPSLEEVCAQLQIEMMERHTAAGDTFTTAEVFLLLTGRMRQRFARFPLLRDLPRLRL
jgi:DNA polymerase III subunit epsilon